MASEQGRGAQVRLDGEVRQYARGGTSLRLIDNIREKLELEDSGTVADGNSADGSAGDGTAAEDEVLVPGGLAVAGNFSFTPAGVGAATRTVQAKLDGMALTASDFSTAAALEIAAGNRTVTEVAGERIFSGPDQTTQFLIDYTPDVDDYFLATGGIAGVGPVLLAASDTSANVDGNFAAKGTGGIYFGNGSGIQGAVLDSGVATDSYPALIGGSLTAPAVVTARSLSGLSNVPLGLIPLGSGGIVAAITDSTATGGNARGTYSVDLQTNRSQAGNVASGALSGVLSGGDNSAAGIFAVVSGGNFNRASGNYSWSPGGILASVRGTMGKGAWASGQFSAGGDAQAGEQVLRRQTTSATAVTLTADNADPTATTVILLPNNGTYLVRAFVVARQTGGSAGTAGDSAGWEVTALVTRGASAATTAMVAGTSSPAAPGWNSAGASAWSLTIIADTAAGGLYIKGVGEANKNINWVARVLSVEVVG